MKWNSNKNSDLPRSSESYVESYTTSFGSDYSGFGDYSAMLNIKNPQISSSYTSFGLPSVNNKFGSTSFVNYPQSNGLNDSGSSKYPNSVTHPSSYETPSQFSTTYGGGFTSSSSHEEATPISQHVEVTRPVAVPVYKKFPYPVSKKFPG